MDRVEEAAVLECLREIHGPLKLGNADIIAGRLVALDSGIDREKAKACVNGQYVRVEERRRISKAALTILRENSERISEYYKDKNETNTERYISDIVAGPNSTKFVDIIFRNWTAPAKAGSHAFKTGVYQIFRRYKPPRELREGSDGATDYWSEAIHHVVICELIYVNSDAMECMLITAEMNVYVGTFFINYENSLYGILQRRNTRNHGIHQRFIASKLEARELPLYSGLSLKTGDTTRRPIASECLYMPIPVEHAELHERLVTLYKGIKSQPRSKRTANVRNDTVISQYITRNPPLKPYKEGDPAWHGVKFVLDFPALIRRVKPDKDGVILFREPSRPVSVDQIVAMSEEYPLGVFRHDGWSPEGQKDV